METVSVPLPKSLYDQVVRRAATRNQAPARLVEEILSEELTVGAKVAYKTV